MGKHNNKGRGGSSTRFVQLYHYMTESPAWRDLDAVARAIYVELSRRYAGPGSNNGRIAYSVRQGAAELRVSKATASRALTALISHGFIVPMAKGAFSFKKRHATEWRLTEFPCDVTHTVAGSKEFMRWQSASRPADNVAPFLRPTPRAAEAPTPGKLYVSLS